MVPGLGLSQMMIHWTKVMEWVSFKTILHLKFTSQGQLAGGKGEAAEASGQPQKELWHRIPSVGHCQPSPQLWALPASWGGAKSVGAVTCGVVCSRAWLLGSVGRGMGRKGDGCQARRGSVVPCGKAAAGGIRRGERSTWLLPSHWAHLGTQSPHPQSL